MFLILVLVAFSAFGQVADLVIENATVYTVDQTKPGAKSLAIKDGKFLAVGGDMKKHIGPKTQRIDAHGAAIIPGLIDAHVHLRGLGDLLETFDMRFTKTKEEVAQQVKQAAAKLPAGEWVRGRNWDQTNWGGEFPNADDISKVVNDRPVYLTRVDGHAGWANRRALELAGVSKATPDPPGGQIVRDKDGNPTGVFVDAAQGLVTRKIPDLSFEQVKRRLKLAAEASVKLGLTSVHDAGIGTPERDAYRELIRENALPLRVYAMIGGTGSLWQEYAKSGPEIGDHLTVRSVKLYADGALGSRGAALWQPYSDDKSTNGLLVTTQETLEDQIAEVAAKQFQVCTHAIGDRANRIVLDSYAKVLAGKNDRRFRVEHAQVISLPDFQRFKDFDIIPSMQATHATSDMRWAAQRLGPDRMAGAYAWRRFLKMGIKIANGSDFPVEDPNPLWGFYATFTRQDHNGEPKGGWIPEEALTRAEALESFTLTPARAAFEENQKGSITVGKLADFLILDRDIMTIAPKDVLGTKIRATYVGGKRVYALN
ncbi:amidohydrolase [Bryobacter aggregatus]|uniref:amidohydrolase n=1 Tax=Bryobacter aggregatus TaxID=360054 RepID=UPI0004E12F66|nr:amidohydrolase [Bryobacter aggregatus]